MNHSEEIAEQLLGSVVTGTKPWNHSYNVGLVVAQSISEEKAETIKIMWMNRKLSEGTTRIPDGKYVYTWEHPTSVSVLSRKENHG